MFAFIYAEPIENSNNYFMEFGKPYNITFSDGRKIELGEQHPIFTERKGWKRAFSLYPDIDIPFFSDYPEQKFKDEISIERARIIACLLSCGHMNNSHFKSLDKRDGRIYNKVKHEIQYANSNKKLVDMFRRDFKKEFGIEMKFRNRKNVNCYYLGKDNVKVFKELNKYVPSGNKSHIIEIPECIFNASKEIQKEFIATLFSGDGYISKENSSCNVDYFTMSNKLANQLQLILLQYGVISHICKRKVKNGNILNIVSITNKQNILNFCKFVEKLPNDKKDKRLKYMAYRLVSLKKHLKPRKFYVRSKEKLKLLDEYVYDIFVEDNHNFILNGILTKNSGKSFTAISLCAYHMALNNRLFSTDYICANAYEFLEKLKSMPEEELRNSIFLIDEEKQSVFGVGSTARKMKLTDVQNIIAINNISTISLNPNSWANKEANYGLRTFGRCFKTKTCRLMLYNLAEKGKGGELPMGNVYLPIFTAFLPKEYADSVEGAYLKKKNEWVMGEMRGEGDVLAEIRKKSAESFCRDKNFLQIKKKKERLGYIQQKMGSEWTSKECEDVLTLASLIQQGLLDTSE
jgi:hypothetical protein